MGKDVKKEPVRTCTVIDFKPIDREVKVTIQTFRPREVGEDFDHIVGTYEQTFNLNVIPFDMAMRCVTELLYPRVQNRM